MTRLQKQSLEGCSESLAIAFCMQPRLARCWDVSLPKNRAASTFWAAVLMLDGASSGVDVVLLEVQPLGPVRTLQAGSI